MNEENMSAQQRSIAYLASRPEVRKPGYCPHGILAHLFCVHSDVPNRTPKWVRCDERLPAEGREYRARHFGKSTDWRMRIEEGVPKYSAECNLPGVGFVKMYDHAFCNWEWLDEAPARQQHEWGHDGNCKHCHVSPIGCVTWYCAAEAPAQEGQRESAVKGTPYRWNLRQETSAPQCGAIGTATRAVRFPPLSPGTLTRAMRQKQQHDALVAQRRDFHDTFGNGRKY